MEFSEILKRRRSIRRFRQEEIPLETLKELVEAAALAPSAANAQCLRYVLVREKELLRAVLEQTAWGGHVKPYRNPEFGVTGPTAFLAVCTDLRADGKPSPYAETDAGAAIQSVLFRATDLGLDACSDWKTGLCSIWSDSAVRRKIRFCTGSGAENRRRIIWIRTM